MRRSDPMAQTMFILTIHFSLVYMTSSDLNLDFVHGVSTMLDYYLRRGSRKSGQGGPES